MGNFGSLHLANKVGYVDRQKYWYNELTYLQHYSWTPYSRCTWNLSSKIVSHKEEASLSFYHWKIIT
jgi:hypothetical protein